MDNSVKSRGWVKNAAIIFLSVLLVLTFFSNTIMNRSLPEVATVNVVNDAITARVRGTGTVTAQASYQVKAPTTRKIQSVMIRSGQEVSQGDVLFILNDGDSAELDAASETLRKLQLSYDQTAVSLPSFDYTADRKNIERAKAAEAAAQADMQKALDNLANSQEGADLAFYESELQARTMALNKAMAALEETKAAVAKERETAWGDVTELNAWVKLLQQNIDRKGSLTVTKQVPVGASTVAFWSDAAMDGVIHLPSFMPAANYRIVALAELVEQQGEGQTPPEQQTPSEQQTPPEQQGESNMLLMTTQPESTQGDQTAPENPPAAEPTQPAVEPTVTAEPQPQATAEPTVPETPVTPTTEPTPEPTTPVVVVVVTTPEPTVTETPVTPTIEPIPGPTEAPTVEVTYIQNFDIDVNGLTDGEKELLRDRLDKFNREVFNLVTGSETEIGANKMQALEYEIYNVRQAIESLSQTDPRISQAEAAVDAAQAELDAITSLLGGYAADYNNAKAAYEEAKKTRETLETNLNNSMISNSKSAAGTSLTLQDLAYQIERAKKELEEISGGEQNQIIAPVGGIIDAVNYTAGSTPEKDQILCTIEVPDLGYALSFSVTNEQARRLRVGDTATVTNYYWGSEINATLESIRTDPKNPQTNKLLNFTVTGDVNPGSELTLSVGSKSQNYDIVVPNSAIRTDANGSFVLAIEAKNSPLGNRYYAKRVDVTVLASDDINSAVTGDLGFGDFVITTSSRPIKSGDMVRMAN